jgi:replicative DNA helicase
MTDAELGLLGHLIGDGCTLPRHTVQYTTNDPALAETVVRLAGEVFRDTIAPRVQRERSWYQVYLTAAARLTHGVRNPVAAWLDRLGVFGLRSYEKRVPDEVFAQPVEGIARFLRHLWSTDGCVNFSTGVRHYPNVYYASSSEQLARDVQSLLLRLGINATLRRSSQIGKGRDQYHVIVSGGPDVQSFLAQVGVLGQNKTAHAQAMLAYISQRPANTNRDILPSDVWRSLAVPAMQVAGMTVREMHAGIGSAYSGTAIYKQNLGRDRAARLANVVGSNELANLAESDVYWDEITSIEPDGEDDVYDLTVEGLHNFVAGNIVVHNSIEQDADVVMFIYREDAYVRKEEWQNLNPDRPGESYPQGLAQIIVAKHRNGPTGTVHLRFRNNLAKFEDLLILEEDD